jgi:hypothetical protein
VPKRVTSLSESKSGERKVPKNQTIKVKEGILKEEILLVEFKAPKKLVKAFDIKLKSHFSSRSEAIRSLMRTFLSETKERS